MVNRTRRTAWAFGAVLLSVSGIGLAVTGVAAATGGTATVTPSSNVTPSSTVSVSGSGMVNASAQTFTGLVAMTQCGNADSSGNALSSISAADCDGAAQVGNIVFATVTSGTLPATSFKIRESGIGNNNRKCVPVPPATLPCQLGIGDVASSGAQVALTATYTLVAAPPDTTTTTAGGTTTTTAAPTTTTVAPPTTTHTSTAPSTAAPPTGGPQVAAGTVQVIPAPKPAAASRPKLAETGLGAAGW